MSAEQMADLRERLQKAHAELLRMARDDSNWQYERARLGGKAEGVALAIDYLRAYEPVEAQP